MEKKQSLNTKGKSILLIFVCSFLFLRLFHFQASLNYGSDQGLELLDIYDIYKTHKITLIGPPSSFGVEGKNFFVGSAPYYILLPFLIVFKWNPLVISYILILFQLIVLVLLYRVLLKIYKSTSIPYIFSIIYIVSPTMVEYSRFFWNPNFLIPLSGLILYLLLTMRAYNQKSSTREMLKVFGTGFLLGLGLQFHYSFVLAVAITICWFVYKRKTNIPNIVLLSE